MICSCLPTQLGSLLQYLNYRVIKKNPELRQTSIRIHPATDNVAHEIICVPHLNPVVVLLMDYALSR
ncbi:hypothetical protein CIP106467_2719 [Citrobacter europaeus]|nr:hypothetical protein CIP106467_2719 [Citrobacter europaeus]